MKCGWGCGEQLTGRDMRAYFTLKAAAAFRFTGALRTAWKLRIEKKAKRSEKSALRRRPPEHQTRSSGSGDL
jgi:hypothetical protein